MKKAVGAVLLLLVVAAGVFMLTKKEKKSELKEVIVKKVTTDRFIESIKVEGDIEIKDEKEIFLSKNQRVENVFVEEGDEVKKGEILISFDPDERESIIRNIKMKELEIEREKLKQKEYKFETSGINVESAKKEIEKLEGNRNILSQKVKTAEMEKKNLEFNLETREKELEVKRKIYEAGGISFTELKDFENSVNELKKDVAAKENSIEEAKYNQAENQRELELKKSQYADEKKKYGENSIVRENSIAISQNNLKKMVIELEELKTELSKTYKDIKSPVDGTVITVKAEPNFRVNVEQSLMTIADIGSQIIKAKVLSSDIGKVKLGQKVLISSDSAQNGREIEGKISKISTIATEDQGNGYSDVVVNVEIEFDAKKSGMRPGYKVNCEIVVDEKPDVTYISQFAVQRENGKKYVMIYTKEGSAKKVYIETGMENDTDVEVLNLPKTTEVIMNSRDIKDGDKVKKVDKIKGNVKLKENKRNDFGGH